MMEFIICRDRPEAGLQAPLRTWLRVDDSGRVIKADARADILFGYSADELVGQPLARILASRQDDPFDPANRHRIEHSRDLLVTFRHKDGFFFTARLARRQAHEALQSASPGILPQAAAAMPDTLLAQAEAEARFGLWRLNPERREMSWSPGLYRLLELNPCVHLTPEQALFYCQSRQHRVRALLRRCLRDGRPFSLELDLLTARHNMRRVRLTGRPVKRKGQIRELAGCVTDQSEILNSQEAVREAHRLLATVGDASQDLIAAVSRDFELLYCNPPFIQHFKETFGCTPEPGKRLAQLLRDHPNVRYLMERLWQKAFEHGEFVVEMPLSPTNQALAIHQFHFHPLTGPGNRIRGAVHVARRLDPHKLQSPESRYRWRHDPVTGLMHRRAFMARLTCILERGPEGNTCSSLLYLDLDDFSRFNDSAGSGTGDHYLRALASALMLQVRPCDTLARLDGDTFALLIAPCPEAEARQIADNMLRQIRSFSFEWQGRSLGTTASGGLLVLNPQSCDDAEQLLAQAADLCHTAKISGRNRIHVAHARPPSDPSFRNNQWVAQIESALEQGRLVLEYQPLKPVASTTWGDLLEVFCRIPGNGNEDDLLHPEQFLPTSERFDLARRLDRQVITQTLAWLEQQRWLQPRLRYLGFNLSLASILDDTFIDFLEDALRTSRYDPGSFVLEIREAHASQYPDDVAVLCDAAHRLGCRLAVEGAGTSVESYHLAATLPVDLIKLDQRLMQNLASDPVQLVMVESLHRIACSAGKSTVATFIEDSDTLRTVRTLGLHFGQGYHLGPPRPLTSLAGAREERPA